MLEEGNWIEGRQGPERRRYRMSLGPNIGNARAASGWPVLKKKRAFEKKHRARICLTNLLGVNNLWCHPRGRFSASGPEPAREVVVRFQKILSVSTLVNFSPVRSKSFAILARQAPC